MTDHHWQDARLKKALQHAPDRDLKPSKEVRDHILHTAKQATLQTPETSSDNWKKTLAQFFAPKSRMPWNAAWGTALLIICVGVFWTFHNPETAFEPAPVDHFPKPTQPPATITATQDASPVATQAPSQENDETVETSILDATVDMPPSAGHTSAPPIAVTPPVATAPVATPAPASDSASAAPNLTSSSGSFGGSRYDATTRQDQMTPPPMAIQHDAADAESATLQAESRRLAVEQASLAEREREAEAMRRQAPSRPEPTVTAAPTPVASAPEIPMQAAEEKRLTENERQREQASEISASTGKISQPMEAPSLVQSTHTDSSMSPPSPASESSNGNYDSALFQADTKHDGISATLAGMADMPAPAEPAASTAGDYVIAEEAGISPAPAPIEQPISLSDQLSVAMKEWHTLQFKAGNQTHTLQRHQAAPLPAILPRITSTHQTIDHAPATHADAWVLVFYAQDHTALGTLTIQGNVWFFQHQQVPALSGKLSESQRQQLEEVLTTLSQKP